ncbi:hypothetical protein Hanom_Chr14g01331471 [Helianthus anomalus]
MINPASRKKNQVFSSRNEQVIPSLVVLVRFESGESVQVLGGAWVLIGR